MHFKSLSYFSEVSEYGVFAQLEHVSNMYHRVGVVISANKYEKLSVGKRVEISVKGVAQAVYVVFFVLAGLPADAFVKLFKRYAHLGGDAFTRGGSSDSAKSSISHYFREKRLKQGRPCGRDRIPRPEISVVQTFLGIHVIVENVVGYSVKIFSVLYIGGIDCLFLSLPIQRYDLLVRENRPSEVFLLIIRVNKSFLLRVKFNSTS